MAIFGRKRKEREGIIDVGDGTVLVSPERQDELADQTVEWVSDNYDYPISKEVSDAIGLAVDDRHQGELGGKLKSLLATTAIMGYTARRNEDQLDSIRADSPVLKREIEETTKAGASTAEALSVVALASCDLDGADARATFDGIEGMGGIRERVAEKTVVLSARLAVEMELADPGELPPGVDFKELLAAWRSGFLIRACEQSLDADVDLTVDDVRRQIFVNVTAVEAAVEEWFDGEPQEPSQEEVEAMTQQLIEDPRFHLDPNDPDAVDDDEIRFSLFEFDQAGRMLTPED